MKFAAPTVESTKRFRWSGTSTAALVAIFNFSICYFRSFVFPNIPVLPWGDAVGFLNNGARIVAGRLPYRDYFAFVPAGNGINLRSPHPGIRRALLDPAYRRVWRQQPQR